MQGHAGSLKCVQMDDWKVISGGNEGMVIVWDQRMASKLWEQHNRWLLEFVYEYHLLAELFYLNHLIKSLI